MEATRPARLAVLIALAACAAPVARGQERQEDKDAERVRELIQKLKDDRSYVRMRAASDLGRIGPAAKEAVPALAEALNDRDHYVRSRAVSALGRIGPAAKAAVPALTGALKDKGRLQSTSGRRRSAEEDPRREIETPAGLVGTPCGPRRTSCLNASRAGAAQPPCDPRKVSPFTATVELLPRAAPPLQTGPEAIRIPGAPHP